MFSFIIALVSSYLYIIYGWQKTSTLMQYIILQQIRSCEMKIYCMRLDDCESWMRIGLHGDGITAYKSQYRNTSHVGKNEK